MCVGAHKLLMWRRNCPWKGGIFDRPANRIRFLITQNERYGSLAVHSRWLPARACAAAVATIDEVDSIVSTETGENLAWRDLAEEYWAEVAAAAIPLKHKDASSGGLLQHGVGQFGPTDSVRTGRL